MLAWSWPETKFERSGHIGLAICRQKRNSPPFVLHAAREAEARSSEDICIDCDVILAATLWNITRIEDAVPEFDPDFLAWAKPIVALDLFPLCSATDPCSYQATVVGISANILRVVVNANPTEGGRIGVSPFNSHVQLGNSREFCEV